MNKMDVKVKDGELKSMSFEVIKQVCEIREWRKEPDELNKEVYGGAKIWKGGNVYELHQAQIFMGEVKLSDESQLKEKPQDEAPTNNFVHL